MNIQELTDNQRRIYIDSAQLYEAYLDARKKSLHYAGSMYWKKAKGYEYLFRLRDRYGHGKSLGRRSPETEKTLSDFHRGKQEAKERAASLRERLKEQARFCKACGIERVPTVNTRILRLLENEGMLGQNVIIVGTNALYAYEAAAGVHFDPALTSTEDMDILWDTRTRLTLYGEKRIAKVGLLHLLCKADKSFKTVRSGSFRAVNTDGYMVDLIKPIPKIPWKQEPNRIGGPEDLVAAGIRNLQWLVCSPKFKQIVIGRDGFPATMVAPDPRAFALHKLWLSRQDDRDAVRKPRDRAQALAVVSLILRYLPQYPFNSTELRMFPKQVFQDAQDHLKKQKVPAGLDFDL